MGIQQSKWMGDVLAATFDAVVQTLAILGKTGRNNRFLRGSWHPKMASVGMARMHNKVSKINLSQPVGSQNKFKS